MTELLRGLSVELTVPQYCGGCIGKCKFAEMWRSAENLPLACGTPDSVDKQECGFEVVSNVKLYYSILSLPEKRELTVSWSLF